MGKVGLRQREEANGALILPLPTLAWNTARPCLSRMESCNGAHKSSKGELTTNRHFHLGNFSPLSEQGRCYTTEATHGVTF